MGGSASTRMIANGPAGAGQALFWHRSSSAAKMATWRAGAALRASNDGRT